MEISTSAFRNCWFELAPALEDADRRYLRIRARTSKNSTPRPYRFNVAEDSLNDSLYEVLGVKETATQEQIEAAYKKLIKQVHPDVGGNESLFRRVRHAYETLSNPSSRAAYDTGAKGASASTADDFSADSGWRRVDDPPPWNPPPNQPPPYEPSNPWNGPDPSPPADEGSEAPFRHLKANPAIAFLRRNPWVGLVVVALVIAPFESTFAVIIFLVALVAALGSRRAARERAFSHTGYESVDLMDGVSFERYVETVMRASGYRVKHVGRSGDSGADLVAERDGIRSVVQAKRYSGNVGVDAIQEVATARAPYDAQHAIVVTSSYFTDAAIRLAKSNDVELWDRRRLADLALNLRDYEPEPFSLLLSELGVGFGLILRLIGAFLGAVVLASAAGSERRSRRR